MSQYSPPTPISAGSSFSSCPLPPSSQAPPPASPPIHAGQLPATPPEYHPEPVPPTLSAFFASITDFLEDGYLHEKTLTLTQVSPARLQRFQRWALNHRRHRLRYTYEAATNTLTLRGMITPVHAALHEWLAEVRLGLPISAEERSHIRMRTSYNVPLPGGDSRQPDAAFFYHSGRGANDLYPRVLFEVAFSQRHEQVKSLAERWLKDIKRALKVVVVINIEEGRRPSAAESCGGTGEGDNAEEHDGSDGLAGSDAESEDFTQTEQGMTEFHRDCNPSDFVGPLEATAELFRLGEDGKMKRDGPAYRFLPDRSPDADPVLKISDILRGISDDDQRTVALPLASYGQMLEMSRRELAVARKNVQKRDKRKRVEEAGEAGEDFAPEDSPEPVEREVKRMRLLRSTSRRGRGGDAAG